MPRLSSLITPKSRAEFEQEFPPIPQDIYQPQSRPITNDSVMDGMGQNYIINESTGRKTILPPSMQQMQLSGGRTGYLDPRRQEVIMDTDVGQMAVPLAQIQANDRALQQQQEMANLQRQAQMHQLRVQAGLVPKEAEKPQFNAEMGGYVYPPSEQYPQGRFIPLTGAAAPKKVQEANEALGIIQQAEDIFKRGSPTESYLGKMRDVGGAVFGVGTKGAQSAAQLKALGGALVSKMPKMSGPQSDKDVQLYREMAGQIADDTVPVETRMAALQEVKRLQQKYAGIQPEPVQQSKSIDQEAVAWAYANPNDPRSFAILKANSR